MAFFKVPTAISIINNAGVGSRLVCNFAGTSISKSVSSPINWQQCRKLKHYQISRVREMYWRGRSFDRVPIEKTRSQYQDWNYRSEIFAFSRRLQENLDEDTLRRIFSQPSYVQSFQDNHTKFNLPNVPVEPNVKLVQRGYALLDDCIKPYLRYTFQRMPEDGIIAITNYLKSETVLADVASWIGCKDIILTTEYPPSQSSMADTVRALLAGIEHDLGKNRTQRFVVDMIISYINDKDILDDIWTIPNPKNTLNLILSNSNLPAYEPRIMFQTGIKTLESCHIIGLYSDKKFLGSSPGETLEIAEECAALDSLQRLFDLKDSRTPFVYGEASEGIPYSSHKDEHDHISTYRIK